jgi:hypothetical protein
MQKYYLSLFPIFIFMRKLSKKKTMSNTDQKVSHAEVGCFSSIAPEEVVDNRLLYFHLQIDHQLVQ